jgi:DNA-binding NarL/FixJ family response regulator
VRAVLRSSADIQICAEASNGSEAIAMALQTHPDMIILDLTMPVMGGFAAAIELRRLLPEMPILFYSMHEGDHLIKEAKRIGVRGYIRKAVISEKLLDAIAELAIRHGTYFPDDST